MCLHFFFRPDMHLLACGYMSLHPFANTGIKASGRTPKRKKEQNQLNNTVQQKSSSIDASQESSLLISSNSSRSQSCLLSSRSSGSFMIFVVCVYVCPVCYYHSLPISLFSTRDRPFHISRASESVVQRFQTTYRSTDFEALRLGKGRSGLSRHSSALARKCPSRSVMHVMKPS